MLKVGLKLECNGYTRLLDNEAYCQEHQIEWVPTVLWGQEKLLEGVITFSVFKDTLKTLF